MLTQSRELIPGKTFPHDMQHAHPDEIHDPPAGVLQERVDAHTLEVIKLLFKEKGLQFLAALLRQACAKQRALPGLGVADCAVITAKTIRELATRISQPGASWGYDTTQKYLVVLCALHFLYKGKSPEGGREYLFPLCRYSPPPTLDPLENVIGGSRHKVQSFARKAKRRFLVYMEQQPSLTLPVQAVASCPFDLSGAVEDLEQILQEELGNGALPQRLLLKMSGVLRYRCQSSTDEQKGDSAQTTNPSQSPLLTETGGSLGRVTQHGRLFRQTGDSLPANPVLTPLNESSFSIPMGDFSGAAALKSRPLGKKGDSPTTVPLAPQPNESPFSAQTGDSFSGESPVKGRLSPHTGHLPSQTGDSASEGALNVNVILRQYIDSFLNDNDKSKVIEYLRTIFDEAPSRRGYYHHLYKHYPHPDAWLAATIETLIAYRMKKTTTTPGKYFYDLCAIFHQQGIPPEVMHHVRQYSYLPYGELLAVLARSPSPGSAAKSGPVRPAKIQRSAIVARLLRDTGRSGMSHADAKRALALLKNDTRTYQIRLAAYRQADGSCVLLADDGMQHPRQMWIYALQDAQHRLASMKTLDDFFAQEVQR